MHEYLSRMGDKLVLIITSRPWREDSASLGNSNKENWNQFYLRKLYSMHIDDHLLARKNDLSFLAIYSWLIKVEELNIFF